MTRRDPALLLLMGLAVAHTALLGWWVVDDAAISFAYARSLASGHGLAPYLGGEQVEGYSNPTWVLLLALGQILGADPFSTSRFLAFGLVAATVPGVWALARRVDPAAGLPAAALFVANTQVAVFGASGLENPLLGFLLVLGLWAVAREIDAGGPPASALVFAALGASRPEGLLYAAAVAPWVLFGVGPARTLRWLGVLAVPTALYQLARYSWFAWPVPMTYYAKVRTELETVVRWQGPGWRYVRGWAFDPVRVWMAPLVLVGALGVARWRAVVGVGLAVAVLALLPEGLRWLGPPCAVALLALATGLALPIVRTDGWAVLGPCWTTTVAAGLFAIRAGGDWMSGHRWFAITAVPLAVLAGVGLVAVGRRLPRAVGVAGGLVVIVAFAVLNVSSTLGYRADPETSAYIVGGRVRSTRDLLDRLHVDERPICMTFDLGGFLWWSGMEIVDAMGLVDVPVALNKQRGAPFWDEYLAERRPHVLIQVGVAAGTDLARGRVLREQYIEAGRTMRVRRDLVFEPVWSGSDDPPVPVDRGVILSGVRLRSARVSDTLELEIGLQSMQGASFTAELLLATPDGAAVASWPLDPAYGLLATPAWRPDEVFHGRYTLALPADLALGPYRIGVRLSVAPETLWQDDPIEVVDAATAREVARVARAEAIAAAAEGRCERADDTRLHDPEMSRARAACWLARTDGDPIARIERARRLDPDVPGLDAVAGPLADARWEEGLRARAAGDTDGAFAAFGDVVRVDPGRPRARRYAEEARATRLDRTPALPPGEGEGDAEQHRDRAGDPARR